MSRANTNEGQFDSACECPSAVFHEINEASSIEFKEAMKIYVESFPEKERRPIAKIEEMLGSEKVRLIIGKKENEVVFMALLYPLKGTPFLLGDYLAAAESYRGKGIGRAFIKYVLDRMEQFQSNFLLIEVENPYLDEDETKGRRMKFYKGLGMKELKGVRYVLPPFQGTESTELVLLINSRENYDHLPGEAVKDLVIQMFAELYDRHVGDEFLMPTLRSISDIMQLD